MEIINLSFQYLPFHDISKEIVYYEYEYQKEEYMLFPLYNTSSCRVIRSLQRKELLEFIEEKCNTRKNHQ